MINHGRETLGKWVNDFKKKDLQEKLTIENAIGKRTQIEVGNLINLIEDMKMAVSA